MQHILMLNSFDFNGKHDLQIKCCAISIVAAPPYTNIYMGKFEETCIYAEINNGCPCTLDIFFMQKEKQNLTIFSLTRRFEP